MKKLLTQSHYCRWACILVTVLSVGCRSTGKFTPSFLSWNRAPDAATLAGGNEVPELPESPASKYTPNAIASVGAKTTSTPDQSTPTSTGGSAYGYNPTTANTAQSQLAAAANGYQTGPYELSPKTGASPYSGTTSTVATSGLPSPYGGSASMASAPQTADIALPNSVAGAMAGASGYPSASAGGMPGYPSVGQTKPQTNMSMATYPGSSGTVGSGTVGYPTGTPAYPAIPSAGTSGATTAAPTYPSLPPVAGSTNTGSAASSSAYQGSSSNLNRYSPGSTGRSTGYDFSSGATTATPSSVAPSYTLPPNTANQGSPMLR